MAVLEVRNHGLFHRDGNRFCDRRLGTADLDLLSSRVPPGSDCYIGGNEVAAADAGAAAGSDETTDMAIAIGAGGTAESDDAGDEAAVAIGNAAEDGVADAGGGSAFDGNVGAEVDDGSPPSCLLSSLRLLSLLLVSGTESCYRSYSHSCS